MTARRADDFVAFELPDGSLEDKELTLAFQRGEKGSYQAIYDRYSARVNGVCRRMLHNPQDAEEAAQETFLRTYQALQRFNGRYHLGAWITRIATNVCLDQLRARGRRPTQTSPIEVLEYEPNGAEEDNDPEVLFLRDAESKKVRRVLKSLPPLHRAAIVLRDFEGLSYQEISTVLEITESQVKALLHRARKAFKRSWTASFLAALVPGRYLHRLRQVETPAREQASQAAASVSQAATSATPAVSSASQAVVSCSGVLQHCGNFVAEHVATAVAVVVVGTAAVSGAVVPAESAPAETVVDEAADAEPLIAALEPEPPPKEAGQAADDEPEPVATPAEEPPAAAEPTPGFTPEATPQPQTTPTPASSPTTTPTPSPSPAASPGGPNQPNNANGGSQPPQHSKAPLRLSYDSTHPASNYSASVDCDARSVWQRMNTSLSQGDARYPASWVLNAGEDAGFGLTLWKEGREIYYSGSGTLKSTNRDGSRLTLSYGGVYRTDDSDAKESKLPEGGSFQLDLVLDCTTSSVVTEYGVLSTS